MDYQLCDAKMDDADIEKCIKFIDDSKVKKILIETTEEALEYGVSHFLKLNEFGFKGVKSHI